MRIKEQAVLLEIVGLTFNSKSAASRYEDLIIKIQFQYLLQTRPLHCSIPVAFAFGSKVQLLMVLDSSAMDFRYSNMKFNNKQNFRSQFPDWPIGPPCQEQGQIELPKEWDSLNILHQLSLSGLLFFLLIRREVVRGGDENYVEALSQNRLPYPPSLQLLDSLPNPIVIACSLCSRTLQQRYLRYFFCSSCFNRVTSLLRKFALSEVEIRKAFIKLRLQRRLASYRLSDIWPDMEDECKQDKFQNLNNRSCICVLVTFSF